MMKRILCALLALLTVLILPSCSNNEAPEQTDEKENVSVVTPREEPLNRTEKLEEVFYHKITGEEIGRVDITVDYDYNFAEAKINDCKTETEQKEGYKVTVTKEINGGTFRTAAPKINFSDISNNDYCERLKEFLSDSNITVNYSENYSYKTNLSKIIYEAR